LYSDEKRGAISVQELGTIIRSLGYSITEAELTAIINQIDGDGNTKKRNFDGFILVFCFFLFFSLLGTDTIDLPDLTELIARHHMRRAATALDVISDFAPFDMLNTGKPMPLLPLLLSISALNHNLSGA
jgi:hypothetical protein